MYRGDTRADELRDLRDLQLLEGLVATGAWPQVRDACATLFAERAGHTWPPTVVEFEGWGDGYNTLATDVGFDVTDVKIAIARVEELLHRTDVSFDSPDTS